jgi:hypothetical protein
MKRLLLLFVLSAALSPAGAADKNKPVDLTGHWKEVSRLSRTGERLDYADTTFYDFLIGNEYTTQRKNSFMYRGTYKATSGTLDLGMRMYNILDRSRDRIVLKDDAGSYEFVRYDKEAVMAAAAGPGRKTGYRDEISTSAVGVGQLAGKWEVYKRTSNTKLPEIDYTRIIQAIEVKPEGDGTGGSVWAAKDMDGAPSWKIVRYADNVIYCSGKSDRRLKVLRCQDGELIVQEDAITYFFKQFK